MPLPGAAMEWFISLPNDIVRDDQADGDWITRAEAHALTLPARKPKKKV